MNTNSFDIIEESSAVATISGTAGFEAICQNKKVLLFGDVDYVNRQMSLSVMIAQNFA